MCVGGEWNKRKGHFSISLGLCEYKLLHVQYPCITFLHIAHIIFIHFSGYKYTVLPARTLVEVANMKMEKLKMIAMAMIMGGTFGGVAGTLEGATLLGMVIGAAAGAAEVTCLENGMSTV